MLLHFDGGSKLTCGIDLFLRGFSHLVGAFLVPNSSLLLGSYITTREGQFSPRSHGKNEKVYAVTPRKDFLSKSVKIFHHIFDIAHNQGHTLLQMLYLASVCKNTIFHCVEYQPSQCIFALNFDHFSSLFNF